MAAPVRRVFSIEAVLVAVVLCFFVCAQAACAQTPLLPSAVAYDAAGNLYIADRDRNQVFELPVNGVLAVFAGTSVQGFSGDGGAATAAALNAPEGIAVGPDGTVYIADTGNQRIRAVSGGVMRTIAGTGARGFSGDGSAATSAQFNTPTCVAVDTHGAVFVCDTGNQRIRKLNGAIITTLAGSGVQGFAGDGGPATAAELNSPRGVAVDAAGRVLIADTLNQRVRAVGVDGVITTLAGTGAAAYRGDGGPAVAAALSLPKAVQTDAAGNIFIADTGNERLREVNASGVISTVAGSGVQGFSSDGAMAVAASLNRPLALGLTGTGNVVFSDSQNARVRMIAANGQMFTLVPAVASAASQTTLGLAAQAVYGTPMATVNVSSSTLQPAGSVQVLEGKTVVATAQLQNGAATLSLASLQVGTHLLQAVYTGDALHAPSVSAAQALAITTASVTASATPASAAYGQAVPLLSGTVAGLLAQDAATTSVQFTTAAAALSPVGTYPITATLQGASSSNYTLTTSPSSGVFTVVAAASAVTLQSPTVTSYAGLPVLLTAQVSSSTAAVVTGQAQFYDAGALIATAAVTNGAASATYTPSLGGSHNLTVSFGGNPNFLPSTSAPLVLATVAMPDFTLTASSISQTVQGGLPASYALNVASSGGAFTGIVSLAISGLPKGATAAFAPSLVVPGAGGAATTLTVQTAQLSARSSTPLFVVWSCSFAAIFLMRRRNAAFATKAVCVVISLAALVVLSGCGARTVESAVTASQLTQLTVTATSTNLAGTIVIHTLALNLTVE